jgi:transcriptional regulator with XRE-family HTH domain
MESHRSKEFCERFAEALRVRLYPNSTLHLKQLAAGISRSEHSISRWWHGESRPLAEDIDRMASFFARRGDSGFLAEIFGPGASAETISDERLIEFFRKLMASAAAAERETAQQLWFDADGAMTAAPLGHARFAASVLGMPMSGDLVRYAISMLGWIAVTAPTDGPLVIRHDGRRIAPLAAERLCEWLRTVRAKTASVRRQVHLEKKWIDAEHDSLESAACAIERVAFILRAPRKRWTITELPLDAVAHPVLRNLLTVYRRAPDKIIHAAADMGAFTMSGVFRVTGNEVISHHVATEFPDLDPLQNEGKNVLSRPDTDYAVMVWARMLKTKRQGASFHDLSGSVNNCNVRYLNLALSEPGPMGRVLSSSVVLNREPIAA